MRSLRVALWPWAVGLLFQLAVGAMGMGAAPSAGQPLPPPPAAAKPAEPKPPPPKGSHVPADKNNCIACHGESDLWEKETRHLYISKDALKNDVHWNAGVNCHDCHGGNYQAEEQNAAHRIEDGFRSKLPDMRKQCAVCHKEEALSLRKSVHEHANAGAKNQAGQSPPLDCDQCHGKLAHELLPVHDSNSPVFLDHQIKTCGGCHEEHLATYLKSVHGQGLEKLGLMVVPACADCHGAHGVYRAIDLRSTLNVAHVADTCGKCHRYIKERLEASIHGGPTGPGGLAKRNAPGGKSQQKPSCTSCHQKHDILDVESAQFRQEMPHRCGNCHIGLSSRYAMSIHGRLSELGYGPAAKCSDCHGAHTIQAVSDPRSMVSPENRAQTCRECHPHTTANFLNFDPHADHTDARRSPLVHGVYLVLLTLLLTTFGFFGLHSLLWLIRGLVEVFRHGRPRGLRPGETAYLRFPKFHRLGHSVLLTAFLGLALTGLPLKYSHTQWARTLAGAMGGFASTSFWHRVCALVTFACFFIYLYRLSLVLRKDRRRGDSLLGAIFGPDSPMPNFRDFKDFFGMVRWFFWLGPKPSFDRWAYLEKFDFWGAAADIIIIGSTGLVLWFPNFFCRFLPGVSLNIAQVIHSTQALLATGFVFAIHFFNVHLRPDVFPADKSILTGLVSEAEFREARGDMYDRLKRSGELDALRTVGPSWTRLFLVTGAGYIAFFIGMALLVGMIAAGLGG